MAALVNSFPMTIKVKIEQIVGDNIRGYRHQLELSQEKLAEIADMKPNYVGEIERAEKIMRINQVYKLAMALGVDVGLLFQKQSYKIHKAKKKLY